MTRKPDESVPRCPPDADTCRRGIGTFEAAQELAIRESEVRAAAMAETFLTSASHDAVRLAELVDNLSAGGEQAALVAELQGILHNLKGQGGTFGFELLSAVAESGCAYLRCTGASGPDPVALRHHVTAVETILSRRIKGTGGALGERLLARLKTVRAGGGERFPS
ncbi:MAG: hypothetical protein EXQ96_06580 [Alphaproteobacteria bacterium]|nr:hypothetical protein [Alphaproteobacteria bacterium]